MKAQADASDEALELIDEAISLDVAAFGEAHPETQLDIEIRDRIRRGESVTEPPLW